jgi:predicted phosphodiesterase
MSLEKIVKNEQKPSESIKSMRIHNIKEDQYDKIKLVPLGDIHYGAKECNIERAKQTIDWIASRPDARVILMGDAINCATKNSIGAGPFEESKSGQSQYDDMIDMLQPIKSKIYGGLMGNHEYRVFKETGYDVTKMMARQLGHKYYGFGIFVKLQVKDQNYILYATHGSSGATLPYTKIKKVLDMGRFIDADCFLYGHVHSLQVHTQYYKAVNLRNKTVERKKKYYVLTGHYLNYEDSYAEMKNVLPEKQGSPTITFTGGKQGRHIRVIV